MPQLCACALAFSITLKLPHFAAACGASPCPLNCIWFPCYCAHELCAANLKHRGMNRTCQNNVCLRACGCYVRKCHYARFLQSASRNEHLVFCEACWTCVNGCVFLPVCPGPSCIGHSAAWLPRYYCKQGHVADPYRKFNMTLRLHNRSQNLTFTLMHCNRQHVCALLCDNVYDGPKC